MLALRIKIEWYRGSYLFGKSLFKKYRPVPAHTYGNLERHPRTLLVGEKRKQKSILAHNFYEDKERNFAPRTIQKLCYRNGNWWTETESDANSIGNGNERRRIRFRGINLPAKTPKSENPISFVDKPFPLNDAAEHFQRLSNYGYNLIRLGVTWEAVMHKGPGIIDQEYLA